MFFGIVPLFLVQEREGAVKRVSQETCPVFYSQEIPVDGVPGSGWKWYAFASKSM